MAKKVITLDELARMVKDGFDGVGKHLREHDKRFEAIEKRFEIIDKRFEAIDKRFDKVEERLGRIELLFITDHRKRIERLEDKVLKLESMAR